MIETVPTHPMKKTTLEEVISKINDETCSIQIIKNHENNTQASIVLGDKFFTVGYEIEYSSIDEVITSIKEAVTDDTIIVMYNDIEISEAWKKSYLASGITEDRWDRRVVFYPYNQLNEMFCIDMTIYEDITDYWKGTDHELTRDKSIWRFEIIRWYKNHLI